MTGSVENKNICNMFEIVENSVNVGSWGGATQMQAPISVIGWV